MPIKIPNDLPASTILRDEGISVMREDDAIRQDIRPMEIAVLNLMPEKVKTETQLARKLGRSPLQVTMTLITTGSYTPKNAPASHMSTFYKPWKEVRHRKFDGLIVTGAPIERMDFEEVVYWPEMCEILDWAETNVHGCFYLCWAGQAALYHHYGIPKYDMGRKLSGIYSHRLRTRSQPLVVGLDDDFDVPVSRWTEVHEDDIARHEDLIVLADSDDAGICLMQDRSGRRVFMFNHLEYDAGTLRDEYERDRAASPDAQVPARYFPDDDPSREPRNRWRSNGQMLYGNWLNIIYQTTPFDIEQIGLDLVPDAKLSAAD